MVQFVLRSQSVAANNCGIWFASVHIRGPLFDIGNVFARASEAYTRSARDHE